MNQTDKFIEFLDMNMYYYDKKQTLNTLNDLNNLELFLLDNNLYEFLLSDIDLKKVYEFFINKYFFNDFKKFDKMDYLNNIGDKIELNNELIGVKIECNNILIESDKYNNPILNYDYYNYSDMDLFYIELTNEYGDLTLLIHYDEYIGDIDFKDIKNIYFK